MQHSTFYAENLRELGVAIDRAQAQVAELLTRRDSMIVRAINEGVRPAQVARITGLSRSRINQIQEKKA